MKKTIFIVSTIVLATGLSIYAYRKFNLGEVLKKAVGGNSTSFDLKDNFAKLQKNLGGIEPNDKGNIAVTFNSKKNQAQFYDNGRIIVFDVAAKKQIGAGNYSNGGLTIVLDNKEPITSGSVYTNLNNLKF
jgi:hypothetical protein